MVERRMEHGQLREVPKILQQIGRSGRIAVAESDPFGKILNSKHVERVQSFFVGSNAGLLARDRYLPERLHGYSGIALEKHVRENIRIIQRELLGKREVSEWPAFIYASSHWMIGPWFQKQNGGHSLRDEMFRPEPAKFHSKSMFSIGDEDFSLKLPIHRMNLFDPFHERKQKDKEVWIAQRNRTSMFSSEPYLGVRGARSEECVVGLGHVGYGHDVKGDEIPGVSSVLVNPESDIDICYFEIPTLQFVLVDPTLPRSQPYFRVSMGYAGGFALRNIAIERGEFVNYSLSTCGADAAFANGFC